MNVLLAILGGAGLYLVLSGLAGFVHRRPPPAGNRLVEITDALNADLDRPKLSVRGRLEALLYQARAPLTVSEFVFTSAAIGAVLALGMFLVSGGLLLSLVVFLGGAVLYYAYLTGRRERLARQYEEVQPQVVYTLYFAFKSYGLNFQGAIQNVAENGPEVVREDWKNLQAAVSTAELNTAALNRLLTDRSSPSFTRIVEALLLFRGRNIEQLPSILEDLRRDISLEVEIARESAAGTFGARRQLQWVALMPVALALIFIVMMPGFKDFYQSLLGQLVLLGMWGFSGAVYFFGARSALKAASVRPYVVAFPEERQASTYTPFEAGPAPSRPKALRPVKFPQPYSGGKASNPMANSLFAVFLILGAVGLWVMVSAALGNLDGLFTRLGRSLRRSPLEGMEPGAAGQPEDASRTWPLSARIAKSFNRVTGQVPDDASLLVRLKRAGMPYTGPAHYYSRQVTYALLFAAFGLANAAAVSLVLHLPALVAVAAAFGLGLLGAAQPAAEVRARLKACSRELVLDMTYQMPRLVLFLEAYGSLQKTIAGYLSTTGAGGMKAHLGSGLKGMGGNRFAELLNQIAAELARGVEPDCIAEHVRERYPVSIELNTFLDIFVAGLDGSLPMKDRLVELANQLRYDLRARQREAAQAANQVVILAAAAELLPIFFVVGAPVLWMAFQMFR